MALPTNSGPPKNGDNKPNTGQGGGLPTPEGARPRPQQGLPPAPVGYPAPRGGLPTPSAPMQRTYAAPPPPPEPEPDPFEPIPVEEVEYYEPEPEPAPARPAPEPEPVVDDWLEEIEPEPAPAPRRRRPEPEPEPEPAADEEANEFINKKQKKLLPFGGSKSDKTKGKDDRASKFDAREDRRTKARVVQAGALAALVGLVGFGGYNAIKPPVGVTADEMNFAISEAISTQDFPFERGSAFSEAFIEAYLEVGQGRELASSDPTLDYFYTGTFSASGEPTINTTSGFSQYIVSAPRVFQRTPVSSESASFVVGTLVESSLTNPEDSNVINPSLKWVFYNVNVFYDKTTDTLAVTPNSPTLVPNKNVGASIDIPPAKAPGDGVENSDIKESLRSTVGGYFEAFAKSSAANHDPINQYLLQGAKSDPSLLTGLDGKFQLSGTPEEAINYTVYGVEGDPNSLALDVKVIWEDATISADLAKAQYTGNYYLKLTKSGNLWLVSAFAPRNYTRAPVQ